MSLTKRRIARGLILTPDDVGVDSVSGELKVALTAQKLQVYLDGALRNVVTENQVQTLTNKSYDANGAGNVLSNVEVDNLAAGVLNIDLSVPTPTDDQIPSALAVQTYV